MQLFLAIVLVCTLGAGAAFAYWTAGSVTGGYGSSAAAAVGGGMTPTASVVSHSVTVTWGASTLTTGTAVTGYLVKRYSGTTATPALAGCTGAVAATSCIETGVPLGTWTYTVTPVFATNWQGAESAQSNAVAVVNAAPVATADSYTVAEDTVLTVAANGVLGNDTDADGDTLTALVTQGVANGLLAFTSNGAFTYTPNANFSGTDSFSYKAYDGSLYSAPVAVTLSVTAVNDPPVNHVPGAQQVAFGTTLVFSAATNNLVSISDIDDTLGTAVEQVTLTVGTGTTTGTVSLTSPSNVSFATGSTNGTAKMTFTGTIAKINASLAGMVFTPSGVGGSTTLTIATNDLDWSAAGGAMSDTDTIAINVNALGIFTANQDIGATGSVGSSTAATTTSPWVYTVKGAGANIWMPPDAFQFVYRALTGDGRLTALVSSETGASSSQAKAGVMFRNTLDPNSTMAYQDVTRSNGPEFIYRTTAGAQASSTNSSGTPPYWVRMTRIGTTFTAETAPASNPTTWTQQGATQTIAAMNGTIFVGLAVTSLSTSQLNTSAFTSVTLTTPPTAVADNYTANENGTLTVSAATGVLSNDTDPEDNTLSAQIGVMPAHGTLTSTPGTGAFVYTPTPGFSGTDSFTYQASDTVFSSPAATVTIVVNPANAVPVFTAGASQTVNQSAAAQTVPAWATAISQGVGDTNQALNFVVSNSNNSLFSVQPTVNATTGALAYTPTPGATGTATVSVFLHDNGGTANLGVDTSATQAFTITVSAVVVITTSTPVLPYLENTGAVVADSAITVTDTLTSTNLTSAAATISPLFSAEDSLAFTNQNGITGSWNASSGVLSLSGSAAASVYQTALRTITYKNGAGTAPDAGNRVVTFSATDGTHTSAAATRTIAVTAVNNAPTGTSTTVTTNEDTPYTFGASDFGFSDTKDMGGSTPAGNAFLQVEITTLPTAGSLTLNGATFAARTFVTVANITSGLLVFTPAANANNGSNPSYGSFTFQVQDDGGTLNGGINLDPTPKTMTVSVVAVDDPPVNSVPLAIQTTPRNVAVVFSGTNGNLISISDIDAGTAAMNIQLAAANGTTTLSTSAGLTFTAGDGTADQTMTFTGTIAAINTALAGMSFAPTAEYTGTGASLQIITNDQGNTGTGGPLVDTDTVAITVLPYFDTVRATSGLVNYWRLGEAAGSKSVIDSETTPDNGTYSGAPTLGGPGAIFGDSNTSVLFNGTSQWATVTNELQGDLSVEFWFKTAQTNIGLGTSWWNGNGLVDGDLTGSAYDFGISLGSGGSVIAGFGMSNNGADVSVVSQNSGYNNSVWHQVVVTRVTKSGAVALYVDGALAGTMTGPVNQKLANTTIAFGRIQTSGNYFAGSLDEIAFYSSPLSAATVLAHYNAGR